MKTGANRKNSLFWRFRKSTDLPWSYLFGTMHTWELEAFNRLDLLYDHMSNCDVFYSEIDLDASKSLHLVQDVFLSTDHSIKEDISAKRYFRIRKILLKAFNIDILYFDRVLPLITLNQMTFNVLKSEAHLSMDQQLWEKAKAMNKKVKGLEGIEQQIDTLKSIPWDYQLKQLMGICRNVAHYRRYIFKLTSQYRFEKIKDLAIMTTKSLGPYAQLMLNDRNVFMANRMIETSEVPSFYAVGAAHLGGYHGILRILRLSGFTVLPIK